MAGFEHLSTVSVESVSGSTLVFEAARAKSRSVACVVYLSDANSMPILPRILVFP